MNVTPRAWWAPTHYRITRTARRASRRAGARLLGLNFDECAWIIGLMPGGYVPKMVVTANGGLMTPDHPAQPVRNAVILSLR